MSEWPVHCFKAYDIRGLASGDGSGELTTDFAYRLGRAIAVYLRCSSFAVGRDIRNSSPALASELISGLTDSGVRVLDLGIVSTGCVYHAVLDLANRWWSHGYSKPPTNADSQWFQNVPVATLPLAGEEIQELKQVFLDGNFIQGQGEVVDSPHIDAYLEAIVESTGQLSRTVKVAVDCGNAVPGPAMSKLLDMIGCEHIDLYCNWDATEPNHGADPTRPENMVDLGRSVVENGCEFGLGSDGDGDQLAQLMKMVTLSIQTG